MRPSPTTPSPDTERILALPTREQIASSTVAVLNRGNRWNPDALLLEHEGRRLVVKDFAPRGRWIRETWGRWNLNRELRAYRALAGHPAVPRLLGRIDALAIAIEYRAGKRLPVGLKGRDPSTFGAALDEAVRGMHGRGVVHLDLRHRSNVLVDDATRPVLIDFASALCFTPGGRLHRWLLPWLARLDLRAVAKWRQRIESEAPRAGSSAPRRGASRPT